MAPRLDGKMLLLVGASIALVAVVPVRSVKRNEGVLSMEILEAFFLDAGGGTEACRFLLLMGAFGGAKFEDSPAVSRSVLTFHSHWLWMRSSFRKRRSSPALANPLACLRLLPSSLSNLFTAFNSSFPVEYSTPVGSAKQSSCIALFRLSSRSWMRSV